MSQVMFLTCAHVEKTKTIGSTSKIERKQKEVEYISISSLYILGFGDTCSSRLTEPPASDLRKVLVCGWKFAGVGCGSHLVLLLEHCFIKLDF